MKTFFFSKPQTLVAALIAAMSFLALVPDTAQARDRFSGWRQAYHHGHSSHHRHHYDRGRYGRSQRLRSQAAAVQHALARRGYYRGPIDGVMGAMAQRAVRDFQRDRGLSVTGNVNTDVLRHLGLL